MGVKVEINRALKKGSREVFQQVFDEYYEMLLHISMQYLSEEDAKEAVQEAFLKLWENRKQVKEDANIRNFLFTIVKNNCLNMIKRQQVVLKNKAPLMWIEMHYEYEAIAKLDYTNLEFEELKERVENAVERLPGQCKTVFMLSRYRHLKNSEIALELGVTEKTVEAHITKALKILRHDLKDYLPILIALNFLS
ncbi:RNA polymerase sigma-70 factor [Sunxiuqinia elliptica]